MNLYERNIIALREKNPSLANKLLLEFPSSDYVLVQQNGFYNLKYKEIFLHNSINPLAEAQEIFSMAENKPISIHIIYGLGLGYLFQFFSAKSEGTVILYEPNLKLLRNTLNLVDFTEDFKKNNVYIVSDMESLSQVIHSKSATKNIPQLFSTISQQQMYKEDFDNLVNKLQEIIGAFYLDLKYTKEKFFSILLALVKNIPQVIKEVPLNCFKDIYKGKTAIVVSAGPTLDRNIETLKKYRENVVIFTVGTALKTLIKNEITPDFVSIIETFDSSKQLQGLDLKEVNFITEPYSHQNLRNFEFKNIFSHISANTPINHLWAEICNENIEEYWSKGTVSYTALNSARLLGFSKIVLVGQDLAYIEGQCYSKDSNYKNLVCKKNETTGNWQIMANDLEEFADSLSNSPDKDERMRAANERLENLNRSLHFVKGITGEMIPTEVVYSSFIAPLTEYTNHFKDRKYINTSLVGAQIDGFENLDLETVLIDSEKNEKLELVSDYKYDIDLIKNNLKKFIQELEYSKKLMNDTLNSYKVLTNEIQRYKAPTLEVLKSFKKLSLNYYDLAIEFTKKSKIFEYMLASEKIDLDYEMKMARQINLDSIEKISSKINRYLKVGFYRFEILYKALKESLEKLEGVE